MDGWKYLFIIYFIYLFLQLEEIATSLSVTGSAFLEAFCFVCVVFFDSLIDSPSPPHSKLQLASFTSAGRTHLQKSAKFYSRIVRKRAPTLRPHLLTGPFPQPPGTLEEVTHA